jgi:hypothetical protein
MLDLPEDELCLWSAIAPRKVLFQLGHGGKVNIKQLLCDDMLEDLTPSGRPDGGSALDWFSPQVHLPSPHVLAEFLVE